jgi:two-component sensor histidine kinase
MFLGQLVNELVINAIKHAFINRPVGEIYVSLRKEGRGFELVVQDNGIGLPAHIEPGKNTNLGMQLMEMLAEQLGGNLQINCNTGTAYKIEFTT